MAGSEAGEPAPADRAKAAAEIADSAAPPEAAKKTEAPAEAADEAEFEIKLGARRDAASDAEDSECEGGAAAAGSSGEDDGFVTGGAACWVRVRQRHGLAAPQAGLHTWPRCVVRHRRVVGHVALAAAAGPPVVWRW
jgi:hypothetical protein